MKPQRRAHGRWVSPWGEFAYRVAVFLRVVALLAGVVMAGLVREGWASFLLQACVEAGSFLVVGILLQLVVLVRDRAVRP
ncbi:hypothetical protein [Cryobacterium zongtaii]|uniref:hypothetical protein n=1 Tax=Cryobacterium zongtaii TaxID=1259217 RepID=UPI001056FD12|nr:hypothetical protein [Cryobacterium zongtaii]